MSLSAAMLALNGKGPFPYLLEIDLPSGTRRYGSGGYDSAGSGMYRAKVLDWKPLVRDASDRTGKLAAMELTVKLDDSDQTFTKEIEGENGPLVRGSAVRAWRAHPSLAKADWYPIFTGILVHPGPKKQNTWEITARVDDRPLMHDVPKNWTLTRTDFPNASADVLGLVAPWIYGKHVSSGIGDKGMVECVYVDTTNKVWLVSALHCKALHNVWADDVKKTLGTDYSVAFPIINGRQYTTITFTSLVPDKVAVDVEGIELIGDGSGDLLENGAQQLAHFLNHAVWRNHQSGTYNYETAPILFTNGVPFEYARTWFNDLGIKSSRVLFQDGVDQAISILDEWCASQDMRAFWNGAGLLNVKPIDHRLTDLYNEANWIREDRHAEVEESFSYDVDDTQEVDTVVLNYLLEAKSGKFKYALEVSDTQLEEQASVGIDLPWSASYS